MEAHILQLLQRLLLLGAAVLTESALETADLVDLCGQTWQGDRLLLRSHSESRKFYFVAQNTDCRLWMWAKPPNNRINFQFHFFLVYSLISASPAPPAPNTSLEWDPCAPGSYLQFYEGPPVTPRPLGPPLCGLTIPASVVSSGPSLGLRLVTRGRQPRVDFVGKVTSLHLGKLG
ncbi:low-density lipoprotein receptor class A domain-containing protein 2 [Rhynchocyon petersi]